MINIKKKILKKLYFEDKLSLEAIAKIFNCNWQTVSTRMDEYGFKKRSQWKELKITKEELYDLYWNKELSTGEIAKKFGKNHNEVIRHKLKKFGIPLRTRSESSMLKFNTNYKVINSLTKSKLEKLYLKDALSPHRIADIFGCSGYLIDRKIKEYKIRNKTKEEFYEVIKIPKKELFYLYNTKKYSVTKLAKYFNCGKTTILYRMEKYGIKRRSLKEAFKIAVSEYNYPGYIDGRTPLRSTIRCLEEYNNWRTFVFKRDNYTCQDCGSKIGGSLVAHHIMAFSDILAAFLKKYDNFSVMEDKETLVRLSTKYEPFWDINNGKTLCEDCHFKTDNYGAKSKKRRNRK